MDHKECLYQTQGHLYKNRMFFFLISNNKKACLIKIILLRIEISQCAGSIGSR